MLVRSGAVDVVAIDSVAALTPRAELEGQMGDQTVGLQARMMSQAMRKLAGNLNRTQTLCIFTNQIREKVGVMFGSPETQPGGRALKFYSSQRLDIRRIETLKEGTEAVGNRVRVKVVKNKVAAPFRQAEFDIEFGKGFSTSGCLIDLGIEHNVVTKSGSFFSYGDERLGQGRNNAKAYLDEHVEVAKEIEAKIYEALGIDRDLVQPIDPDAVAVPDDGAGGRRRRCARSDRTGGVTDSERLQHALDLAYRYLGHRDRTVAEVRERLSAERHRAGASSTTAVDELRHLGYLDDARYAQRFAEDRRTIDAWGAERIERRLLAVGVEPDADRGRARRARQRRGARGGARRPAPALRAAPGARPRPRPRARPARPQGLRARPRLRRGPRLRARRGLSVARPPTRPVRPRRLIAPTVARYYDPASERLPARATKDQQISAISVTGSFSFDANIMTASPGRARPSTPIHYRTPPAHLKRGPRPHATFVLVPPPARPVVRSMNHGRRPSGLGAIPARGERTRQWNS